MSKPSRRFRDVAKSAVPAVIGVIAVTMAMPSVPTRQDPPGSRIQNYGELQNRTRIGHLPTLAFGNLCYDSGRAVVC
jgi:hypothetical protein